MTELVRFSAEPTADEIVEVMRRDGALILEDVLTENQVDRALGEVMPYVDATPVGFDDFVGKQTTRTGALVARCPASRDLILDSTVLAAANAFLAPFCERIQLHLSQVIRIKPGQSAQRIHRDRWAWGIHLAHLEPQFNTIWAMTDFHKENGATQVIPGSVVWPDNRIPKKAEVRYAEMRRGSVLLYTGGVFHGGGANESNGDRVGINITYTLGWLRQEENQYLSCPPEIARDLSPELQDLIGYRLGSYALGYYTPPTAPGEGPEIVGPQFALGRHDENGQIGSEELFENVNDKIRSSEN